MLSKRELWFWFCNINGIGYKKMQELLDYYQDVEEIFCAKEETLQEISSLTQKDIDYLKQRHDENEIKKVYDQLQKENVRFIIQEDEEYPKRLQNVYDAPYGLYLKGKLPDSSKPTLAIVGARNCTNYGKEITTYFAQELAKAGVQIVSGLAMGIDGYSHTGALLVNGYTLGILGCGINICYPNSNHRIYHRMEAKGGILSEYGLHLRPLAGNFPRRNRLIAGMSDAILVIEARERSGSFITVDQGLEQGKEIFIVPGRITDELSVGCNRLARMGAQVVCHPNDIMEFFHLKNKEEENTLCEKREYMSSKLTKEEYHIYEMLSLEPMYIGHIIDKTKSDMGRVSEVLLMLELNGMVKQVTKNYYTVML